MIVANPPDSPPRGIRLLAVGMVVLGAYVALGALFSPPGPDPSSTFAWLFVGVAALGTAWAGIGLLTERPGAAGLGMVTMSAWLVASAVEAALLGLAAYANPFTVSVSAFLLVALVVLVRRGS